MKIQNFVAISCITGSLGNICSLIIYRDPESIFTVMSERISKDILTIGKILESPWKY